MKIEIRKIKKDIVQITTLDERWYEIGKDFVPSVTWVSGYYPKGIGFYKWLANKGWDEAELIKTSRGGSGSKVHQGCELLLKNYLAGKKAIVKMNDKFTNSNTGELEELTVEEYEGLMSFVDWWNEIKKGHKVEILEVESVVNNVKEGYAGTRDLKLMIDKQKWIIDFKTSQYVWPEHEIQISAYKHCGDEDAKMGILQLGYKRNKKGWKFTEVEDKFDLFLHAKAIWKNENENVTPKQKDYPKELILK